MFRCRLSRLVACAALIASSTVPAIAQTCTGDCNRDGTVVINELIVGVNIALGRADVRTCPAMDANDDSAVKINELIAAVGNALHSCVNRPTPTATPLVTIAPTATRTPTMPTGNLVPVAVDDTVATLIGVPVRIVVLANDTDANGDPLHVTDFTQPQDGAVSFGDDVATYTPNGAFSGRDSFTYTVADGHGGSASATATIVVESAPPDPAAIAPPPANGTASIVADTTAFLYTGGDAVQFGVAPGTISTVRAAVVRGSVKTRGGTALDGVRVTVLDHPELGFTVTRADGMFDLAVNGGGPLTLDYEKPGFCPVHRVVTAPWQGYATAPDVVMVPLDASVSHIALGAGSDMQTAQGSPQTDASGTRKTTIVFPPGTTATMVMPDGSAEPADALSVRATEFTVGATGPAAMPAALPPTSAYTYCVELSADEAISAGAAMVAFNQPVIQYVENFLGFPVGTPVPTGFYDRQKAAWVPLPNGRVIKIVAISGGLADVDTDGDGLGDDGLAITAEERGRLAALYTAGQSLWRTPIPHFSVVDNNFGFVPANASAPSNAGVSTEMPLPDSCEADGSIIECENQVLGQSLPIVGTPFTLNYRSDRVPDRLAHATFMLSGPDALSPSLSSIDLHIAIAGKSFDQSFPPLPNQQFEFVWDRRDAYGRTLVGGQALTGSIDYIYPASYMSPTADPAFAAAGGIVLLENPTRQQFSLSQSFSTMLGEGLTDARIVGLGGWTLSVHHFFDPVARVLHLGDGRRRRADSLTHVINTVVQKDADGSFSMTVGPDGSIYFPGKDALTVRRLALDGTQTVIAGGGHAGEPDFGDGGPALEAAVLGVDQLAVGPDGSVYFLEAGRIIRHVGLDGIIRRVAGHERFTNGACMSGPDGGPATETDLCIRYFTVGPDGSLYLATRSDLIDDVRVRRVGPDGVLSTVAGNGQACRADDPSCGTDGSAALDVPLTEFSGPLAIGPDGSLYIGQENRIRRVGLDGTITGFAGTGSDVCSFGGDGGPAANASFCLIAAMSFAPDGAMYVGDSARIRRIGADGIVTTVAGDGSFTEAADGSPALLSGLLVPGVGGGLAAEPGGTVAFLSGVGTGGRLRLRRIGTALPGVSGGESVVPSQDGSQVYIFDASGRHLRTIDALTNAVLFEFGYDGDGRLTTVTEKTGGTDNVTTIQHDGAGNPTAIVGPFGQVTTLGVDANGFLNTIANPAGEASQMTSSTGGLMATYTDPRGKTNTFTYDSLGRLTLDDAPAGSTQSLARTTAADQFTVTRTTGLDRITSYEVANLSDQSQRRTVTAPDGTQRQSTEAIDAATTHGTASDGTIADITLGPDPRFSMESPVASDFALQFPSSLQYTTTSTRSAVLMNSADPLSLVSLTETTTLDQQTSTATYTASDRSSVATSPLGRTLTLRFDALGRITEVNVPGIEPSEMNYDDHGRLSAVIDGAGANARTSTFTYTPAGFPGSFTDALGRTAQYTYDAAGRVTQKQLPDGRLISYGYDAAGNLTSVAPPGRPAYTFTYDDRGDLASVTPPTVAGGGPTTYVRDADRSLQTIFRPGSQTVTLARDSAGRLASRTLATGATSTRVSTFSYDPTTGHLSGIAASDGIDIAYTYDGSLLTGEAWSGPITGAVTRSYDTALRRASESVGATPPIAFGYDADGLLTAAGDLAIVRDPHNGFPNTLSLGVTSDTRTYDVTGHLSGDVATAGASALYDASYTRDAVGRLTQKVEHVGGGAATLRYTYDLTGRLTDVAVDDAVTEHYEYDASGNRTSATVRGDTVVATYDAQDRVLQYGDATFTYDGAGYRQRKTAGTHTTTYQYDEVGSLLGVHLPDGTAVTYLIDGRNRRVGKRVNGTLVAGFLYSDHGGPIAEMDGTGSVVSRFIYAGGLTPAYMVKEGGAHRIITDQVGSVRLVVNAASGAIEQRIDYDSFGNVLADSNPGFQPFGFAGGLYDPDTKLVRFGARDYDAETGSWTARDPIWFAGSDLNLYRYGHGDPVNAVDPSGFGDLLDILDTSVQDPLDFYGGVFEGALDLVILGGSVFIAPEATIPLAVYLPNHPVLDTVQSVLGADVIRTQSREFGFGAFIASLLGIGCGGAAKAAIGEAATAAETTVSQAAPRASRGLTVLTAAQAEEGIAAARNAANEAADEAARLQGRAAAEQLLNELQTSGQKANINDSPFGGGPRR